MIDKRILALSIIIIAILLVDLSKIYIPEEFERPMIYRFKALFVKLGTRLVSSYALKLY